MNSVARSELPSRFAPRLWWQPAEGRTRRSAPTGWPSGPAQLEGEEADEALGVADARAGTPRYIAGSFASLRRTVPGQDDRPCVAQGPAKQQGGHAGPPLRDGGQARGGWRGRGVRRVFGG